MTGLLCTSLSAHTWMDMVLSLLRNPRTLTLQPELFKSQLRFQLIWQSQVPLGFGEWEATFPETQDSGKGQTAQPMSRPRLVSVTSARSYFVSQQRKIRHRAVKFYAKTLLSNYLSCFFVQTCLWPWLVLTLYKCYWLSLSRARITAMSHHI